MSTVVPYVPRVGPIRRVNRSDLAQLSARGGMRHEHLADVRVVRSSQQDPAGFYRRDQCPAPQRRMQWVNWIHRSVESVGWIVLASFLALLGWAFVVVAFNL